MEKTEKKYNFHFYILILTLVFNFWFPKAGIKLAGIPLTVGNVFLAFLFIVWIFKKLSSKSLKGTKAGLILLIFIAYCIIKFLIIGNLLENIGFIIPLIIYPLIFYIVYDCIDSHDKMEAVLKTIRIGFYIITIYSIIQYIFGITNTDIPGLTVNYSDYVEYGDRWYLTKSNGVTFENGKIVSTYQNGNLFGINMLLFYPLVYFFYKKNNDNKRLLISFILFALCILLSLSRTAWLGLVLFILLGVLMFKDNTKKSILIKINLIALITCAVLAALFFIPSVSNRLFNTSLSGWISMSGRTEGLLNVIKSLVSSDSILAWLIGPEGISNFNGLAYEMGPLSIFVQIGIIGLVLFYYMIINCINKMNKSSIFQYAIKCSLTMWCIYGCIECGLWLPPTALNLFFVLALGYVYKYKEVEE